jgi:tetraacyldisaccharide 4'-kinase
VSHTRSGPLPRALSPLARLLAKGYGRIIDRRSRRFDAGHGVVTLDRPIISIGNLSVGGTGKTPMTARVIDWLLASGRVPCIAMRGYRASREGESDEARLYAHRWPQVPVVARPDRTAGLIELFASERGSAVDCIVLDDGFQHRQIARQADIVLLDASRAPFDDELLPAGWLREPARSLRRAHAAIVTHAEAADARTVQAVLDRAQALNPALRLAVAEHAWTQLAVYDPGGGATHATEWLIGRRAVLACAIGNPQAFDAAAERALRATPVARMILRDHDPFSARTVGRLADLARKSQASVILVTEKDWMKLRRVPLTNWPCPIAVPLLELRFRTGEATVRNLIELAARPIVDDEAEGVFPPSAEDERRDAPGTSEDRAAEFLRSD